MRVRAWAVTLLVGVLAVLATPLPAEAHAALVSSDPKDGSTLAALPDQVSLTFDEAVDEPAFVSVTSPGGSTLVSGEASVFDTTVSQALGSAPDQGTYTIAYRVTSLDGHPVTGTLTFNVGHPTDPTTDVAEPGPVESGGNSFIAEHVASLTIAMAAITLAICLGILKAARNRAQQPSDQAAVRTESSEPTQGDL